VPGYTRIHNPSPYERPPPRIPIPLDDRQTSARLARNTPSDGGLNPMSAAGVGDLHRAARSREVPAITSRCARGHHASLTLGASYHGASRPLKMSQQSPAPREATTERRKPSPAHPYQLVAASLPHHCQSALLPVTTGLRGLRMRKRSNAGQGASLR
jgi:hypothetical protein